MTVFQLRASRRDVVKGIGSTLGAALASPAHAREFYQGKQISLVVGSDTGGGYDACARLLARHWSKYIPGNPSVIVRNMPGAGSMNAMNFVANVAPKDGLTVGAPQNTIGYEPMMGLSGGRQNARFDPIKMNWLGSMSKEVSVPLLWNPPPVGSLQELIATKRRVTTGSSGLSTPNSTYARLMNATLGTNFDVIQGYASQNALFLAIERGELQGSGAPFYSSVVTSRPDWIAGKKVTLLAQIALEKHPSLPDVPLIFDFLKGEESVREWRLTTAARSMGRPYVLTEGAPAEAVQILRTSFMSTMKDPELLEEAGRLGIEVNPIDGNGVQALLSDMYNMPKDVIETVANIFVPKRQ
jgi:tripartite-type tricarboxylate transporter receptor subunit TctC